MLLIIATIQNIRSPELIQQNGKFVILTNISPFPSDNFLVKSLLIEHWELLYSIQMYVFQNTSFVCF
jgi:hypothetical protein